MDISFISILLYIIVLLCFYIFPFGSWGNKSLTLTELTSNFDERMLAERAHSKYISLGLLVLVVTVIQFILNTWYLANKCGTGWSNNNISTAAIFTFIPWVLIFGVMVATLVIFPGFKSAFSDVIGYYAVSWSANEILAKLLTTDIKDKVKAINGDEAQSEVAKAAEAIMKMAGNNGIIINIMNPDNFINIWDKLEILMDTKLITPEQLSASKEELFNLVVLKDNIGEMLWYIYTGVLISSIVYYNLATRGCVKDADELKKQHDDYIEHQEAADKEKKLAESTIYVS